MKKLCKLFIVTFIVISAFPAASVYAADEQPNTVSLYDIEIFNSLIVDDDFLAVVPYQISFDTEPSIGIDETYLFRILSPGGSEELGVTTASALFNDGYGLGMVSFYFDSGMTANTSYIFRVQQNPAYYPEPDYWDFSVSESNYSQSDDQAAALKAKIIDASSALSVEFGVSLLTTAESGDTVLSSYGELYYLNAIPGLQYMCPALFSVQLVNPDFTKRSWSYTFANSLQTKYAGTFIEDFMTGFGGLFLIDTYPAMNALSMFIFLLVIIISVWKFKATVLSAILDGYCLLLCLMLMGFFSMIWAGFMAFIAVFIGGGILLFKRS